MDDIIKKVEFTLIIKSKMSNLKNLLVKIAAPAVVALPALSAFAQVTEPLVPSNIRTDITTVGGLKNQIESWANTFAAVVALIAVVMLIYAAYLYITAGTNEDNTKKAKTTITYAIIGLVIAILSYTIVKVAISFIASS